MRPETETTPDSVYECFGCGKRTTEPDGRVCDRCGSRMRNIGAARDL